MKLKTRLDKSTEILVNSQKKCNLSSSLTDSLPSLTLLYRSETDARFMQDGRKAVWSIPYVSVAFFPSLKQNFIAYRSSKVSSRPDCIFEIHQLWQSGFSRVYSNYCCSCSFEPEIIKIGQSSHKMYSINIPNFQMSTTILNACTKKVWKVLKAPRINHYRVFNSKSFLYIYIKYMISKKIMGNISKWAWAHFFHTVELFHLFLSDTNNSIFY